MCPVCLLYFTMKSHFFFLYTGKPADLLPNNRSNVDWVPTLLLGHDKMKPVSKSGQDRCQRSRNREDRKSAAQSLLNLSLGRDVEPEHEVSADVTAEVPLDAQLDIGCLETPLTSGITVETQTDMTGTDIDNLLRYSEDVGKFSMDRNEQMYRLRDELIEKDYTSYENMKDDDDRVKYYTGLPTFAILVAIFNLVEPYITVSHLSKLCKFQQLMVVLMRLRLNLSEMDLAYRFGVSQCTISRTFNNTLNILYSRLKHLIVWPKHEQLRETMPMVFRKHFGLKVVSIIDCFEIFIDRPSNLLARAQTWSSYKHHNTIKYLISVTPQGTISFISKAWGGRTSDKKITEDSGYLNKLNVGDVLADRGFNIAETVAMECAASVLIPSFTKGKKQLSAAEVELTRKIAHVRIHVERVIGNVRGKYMFLCGPVPIDLLAKDLNNLTTMDKIVHLCCALTNLSDSVVPKD